MESVVRCRKAKEDSIKGEREGEAATVAAEQERERQTTEARSTFGTRSMFARVAFIK